MEKDYPQEHENLRKQLWISAWAQVAGSLGCQTTDVADRWADKALKSFDERFPIATLKPYPSSTF